MTPSIVVVGAGIFGLTAAGELCGRGWSVTVIDPGPVPRSTAASSDVSKVVRMDYGSDELYTAFAEAALVGWDRWNARWPSSLYHQDGFLLLAPQSMDRGGFERDGFDLLRTRGHGVQRLADLDRAVRFPAWSAANYPDGYFNPRAGWAESEAVTAHVAAEAAAAGVHLAQGVAFGGLIEQRGRIEGVRTAAGEELRADFVLVAAGAWTPVLLPHLSDVMWTIGQPVVHLDAGSDRRWRAPQFPVWAADIARTGWYGFPALDDGSLKIGHHGAGRRMHPDDERVVTAADIDRLRGFLRRDLPALADAPIRRTRVCLYCDTFDGDFWIDHDPARPGLIVAAGDSGHGFKFAPVLGAVIADVVEQRPGPFAARFRWRHRDRDRREAARSDV